MLQQNIKANETIQPNSKELETLKKTFPQFFDKDGNFLRERFDKMLKANNVALSKEGYELAFLGKSYARYVSATKTETFLAPHTAENAKPLNAKSENLYIIGDNLDALKHLLGSYAGKIKCIYIDPPYNTGSDGFVYPDNFSFSAAELSQMIGIEEEEAARIINLKGKSSHSAWLSFMYPRLILARELLTDDGVIFISIDDNEQANLKLACDEIFGEENCVGNLPTIMNLKGNQDEFAFAGTHEYTIVYAKKKEELEIKGLELDEEDIISDWMVDDIGFYKKGASLISTGQNAPREHRPNLWFPILFKDNQLFLPERKLIDSLFNNTTKQFDDDILNKYISDKEKHGYIAILPFVNKQKARWRWSYNKLQRQLHEVIITKTNNGISLNKKQRPELTELPSKKMKTLLYKPEYSSGNGTAEVKTLFHIARIFDNPKPVSLLSDLINISTDSNSIILDFFSGSATTAHAVMQLNAEDGGKRKYIMVQLPETIANDKPAYKAGYKTIDEIGRERIKRAAKKIQAETGADIDYGFKTYSLETPTGTMLDALDAFHPDDAKLLPDDMVGIFDTEYATGKAAILASYLVLDGYGLTAQCEQYTLDTFTAEKIEKSLYLIETGIRSADVMELIRKIESLELDISRVVVYAYSLDFSVLHELRKNLAALRNNKHVELIERY